MEELTNKLLTFLKKENKYYTLEQLRNKFGIKGEKQTTVFSNALKELEINGGLFFDEKKGFKIFSKNMDIITGKIKISKEGTGFVTIQDKYNLLLDSKSLISEHENGTYKIIVDINDLNGALDGDTVLIKDIMPNKYGVYKATVSKVLKRECENVVFECIGSGKSATLIPISIKNNININIPNSQLNSLTDGDIVFIKISNEMDYGKYNANIVSTIRKDEPDAILKLIAFKKNINTVFPKKALEEASILPNEVTEEEFKQYKDFTDKDLYTLDCDNTKDMDDAIGIEINEKGNLVLYVSIALVAHYVKEDSFIFKEALERCSSVYMDNSCIPMLPHKLSNGICSLNPGVNRLARTSIIEIDSSGDIVSFKKINSVINSRKKMRYSEVNKVLEEKLELEEYKPFIKALNKLDILSEQLNSQKANRGYIAFAPTEINVMHNLDNSIKGIELEYQGKAQKLIENIMLLNNQLSAERYSYLPYNYRVHEEMDVENLKELETILNEAGYKINIKNSYSINKTINELLNSFKTKEEFKIISEMILKRMKRARYSNIPMGHFALVLYLYAHTTSPIRRIIDLVNQIYEMKYDEWEEKNIVPSNQEIETINSFFARVCEKASIKEKIYDDAEKEADEIRVAEYAQNLIGQSFNARIFEITSTGIFAIINDTIRGKLRASDIEGDTFKYIKEKKQLIGNKTKHVYHIGKSISVTLSKSFPMNGEIYFTSKVPINEKQKVLTK